MCVVGGLFNTVFCLVSGEILSLTTVTFAGVGFRVFRPFKMSCEVV